jgi:hypothetical protein
MLSWNRSTRTGLFWLAYDALDKPRRYLGKWGGEHIPTRDNDIVVSVLHCKPGRLPHGCFQPASHAVALDRIAVFLGNRESDPRSFIRLFPIKDLQKKGPAPAAFALPHGKKLRPAFQPPDSLFDIRFLRHSPFPGIPVLSRETIAATGAAGSKNLLATLGCHAGTKTVTTLADKLGRLVGTLHLFNTAVCGPSWILPFSRQERFGNDRKLGLGIEAQAGLYGRARLIREFGRKSQLRPAYLHASNHKCRPWTLIMAHGKVAVKVCDK